MSIHHIKPGSSVDRVISGVMRHVQGENPLIVVTFLTYATIEFLYLFSCHNCIPDAII
jgi:hypothetical protein